VLEETTKMDGDESWARHWMTATKG